MALELAIRGSTVLVQDCNRGRCEAALKEVRKADGMRLGVCLPTGGRALEDVVSLAREAETSGFDSL